MTLFSPFYHGGAKMESPRAPSLEIFKKSLRNLLCQLMPPYRKTKKSAAGCEKTENAEKFSLLSNQRLIFCISAVIICFVRTEWYRSGYNGPDSKSGVPATVPWVRIPPTPPSISNPRQGVADAFCMCGMRSLYPEGVNPTHSTKHQRPLLEVADAFLYGWDEKAMLQKGKSPHSLHEKIQQPVGTAVFLFSGGRRRLCRKA